MSLNLRVGDVLHLKKPHACGENAWELYRTGSDLGMRCQGCQRMTLVPRRQIERRIRRIVRNGEVLKPDALKE